MTAQVHVVSKRDPAQHTTVAVNLSCLSSLAESSVRVRSKVISITRNNLSYALRGEIFRWWDAYPVSSFLPSPYNDSEKWGIVPAWGYAEVLESKVPDISKGCLLWGFWPTSSLPVDLALSKAGEADSVYWETSPHRQQLVIKLNNQYEVIREAPSKEVMGWTAGTRTFVDSAYVLSHLCFPPEPSQQPIHPTGSGIWTSEDADLRSTLVVNLCASSRTAHAFAWYLRRRSAEQAPLGILEICSQPSVLPAPETATFETKRVAYEEIASNTWLDWAKKLGSSRVVAFDFGAPATVAESFYDVLMKSEAAPKSYLHVCIGGRPDAEFSKVMFNMSSVKYAACETSGFVEISSLLNTSCDQLLKAKAFGHWTLSWGSDIGGSQGWEGAWEKLVKGSLAKEEVKVIMNGNA